MLLVETFWYTVVIFEELFDLWSYGGSYLEELLKFKGSLILWH